jgi:hypothetical protein
MDGKPNRHRPSWRCKETDLRFDLARIRVVGSRARAFKEQMSVLAHDEMFGLFFYCGDTCCKCLNVRWAGPGHGDIAADGFEMDASPNRKQVRASLALI